MARNHDSSAASSCGGDISVHQRHANFAHIGIVHAERRVMNGRRSATHLVDGLGISSQLQQLGRLRPNTPPGFASTS